MSSALFHLGLPAHSARQIDMASWPEFVRRVEEGGFDTLWHSNERFYREMFIRMAVTATVTTRLGIGGAVVDGYGVNPAVTAQSAATLHELSAGRVTLAVGAGGSGLAAMGITRQKVGRTVADTIVALRSLLDGDRVHMHTHAFTLDDAELHVGTGATRPRLWVASRGRHTLRSGAAVADGVMLASQALPAGARELLSWAGPVVTDRRVMLRIDTCVHPDEGTARDGCRSMAARVLRASHPDRAFLGELASLVPQSVDDAITSGDSAQLEQTAPEIPDELVLAMCWAGTPESVADQVLRIWQETGIHEFGFWLMPAPGQSVDEALQLVASDVVPTIRKAMNQ